MTAKQKKNLKRKLCRKHKKLEQSQNNNNSKLEFTYESLIRISNLPAQFENFMRKNPVESVHDFEEDNI